MTENIIYAIFAVGLLAGCWSFILSKKPYWPMIQTFANVLLVTAVGFNLLVVVLSLLSAYRQYEFIAVLFSTGFHKAILFFFDGVIISFCAAEYVHVRMLKKGEPPEFDKVIVVRNIRWVVASYFLSASIGKIPY